VLVVANVNAPGQIVLSGDKEACARVPEAAKAFGIRRAIPLQVAGAFHSPLMEPARAALEAALAATPMHDPRIPVVSNVTGRAATTASEARALLARQVVAPVLREDSMKTLGAMGIRRCVEPAPGAVLTALLRKNLSEVEGVSYASWTDLAGGATA
jgi:[acyl-carrier-protein] S-malonyltransferase